MSPRLIPSLAVALAVALAVLPNLTHAQRRLASSAKSIAIMHVTVIPMDSERELVDQTRLVSDRRIERIGPAETAPFWTALSSLMGAESSSFPASPICTYTSPAIAKSTRRSRVWMS
jgi:hypothetical protein